MPITGKQLEAGVEITRIIFKANNNKLPRVHEVIDQATRTACAIVKDEKDQVTLADAIVQQMLTIKVVTE